MSTNLHYRCVDHDPFFESQEISLQSYSKDVQSCVEDLLGRERYFQAIESLKALGLSDELDWDAVNVYKRNRFFFFDRHRRCTVEIWDEYGKQHWPEPDPSNLRDLSEDVTSHCMGPFHDHSDPQGRTCGWHARLGVWVTHDENGRLTKQCLLPHQ